MALDKRYLWVLKGEDQVTTGRHGAEDFLGRGQDIGIGIDNELANGTGLVIMDSRGWVAMEPEFVDLVVYRLQSAAETLRNQRRARRS